jgi:hypothetical protein
LQKRSPATTHLGIIYRAVTHDRTNCGQALKVVARLSPPSAVPLLKSSNGMLAALLRIEEGIDPGEA